MPPSRLADAEPRQKRLLIPKTVKKKDFSFSLTHEFDVHALVLSKKNYGSDAESKISPVDLALGWGPMSSPNPLKTIRITQGGRFYRFRYDNTPPILHSAIELNSANMHMVPANDDIEKTLKSVRKGDVVRIKGYLMNASRSDGWKWRSSTTRSDTGGGACEVVYVEHIDIKRY